MSGGTNAYGRHDRYKPLANRIFELMKTEPALAPTSATYTVSLERPSGASSHEVCDNVVRSTNGTYTCVPGDRPGLYLLTPIDGGATIPVLLRTDGVATVEIDVRGYRHSARLYRDDHYRLLAILRSSPTMQSRVTKVTSPMPGLIKSVLVEAGTAVTKGDTICTLEAMKMENAIVAPLEGVVRQCAASAGAAVEKGALLCVIEPHTS